MTLSQVSGVVSESRAEPATCMGITATHRHASSTAVTNEMHAPNTVVASRMGSVTSA